MFTMPYNNNKNGFDRGSSRGGFSSGGGFGGGRSSGGFGGGRSGGGAPRGGPREMHSAVCDTCHKDCKVPFFPKGDKPVLCDNCFGKSDSFTSRPERSNDRSNSFGDRAPRSFEARPAVSGSSESYKKDFAELNQKIDSLIDLFGNFIGMISDEEMDEDDDFEIVKEAPKTAAKADKAESKKADKAEKAPVKKVAKKAVVKKAKK